MVSLNLTSAVTLVLIVQKILLLFCHKLVYFHNIFGSAFDVDLFS